MYARNPVRRAMLLGFLALIAISLSPARSQAENPKAAGDSAAKIHARAVPKALSPSTTKGLAYLVSQQQASGGWGQGGGWRQNTQAGGRVEGAGVVDLPDLGNTCMATLALIRAGNTPQQGPYAANVARAVEFICGQIEKSDDDGLYVTDVRDTQLQQKIGQYVDTFLAGLVLSELKGKLPANGLGKQSLAALEKTVGKIEKNQKADGTFAGNTGWASVLSQGLCSKFLNRAAQQQVAVKDEVLRRDFDQSVAALDRKTGEFKAEPRAGIAAPAASDAGVMLYSAATGASRINDFGLTNLERERVARNTLASKTAKPADKEQAQADLRRIDDVKNAQKAAVGAVVRRLDDEQFVAGFGNNGGEELLSYMNISEMLVAQGGSEWRQWDKSITANVERIQNQDGSWSGNHCITGRTFCTAAALLTLMADRAPVPLAAQIKAGK
ncbi:MAG: prenyltransferase/squalene oxidase repeat-containing protein [Pirellulales bacterium]